MDKENWNDEYRRAYDRGYWDARRELQGRLERHGNERGGERGGQRRSERSGGGEEYRGGAERYDRPYGGGSEGYRGGMGRSGNERYRGGYEQREYGRDRDWERDRRSEYGDRDSGRRQENERFRERGGYYDYDPGDRREAIGGEDRDRGFFDRAADEVRSWFGDDDADHRRRSDARRDVDEHYHRHEGSTWPSSYRDERRRDDYYRDRD